MMRCKCLFAFVFILMLSAGVMARAETTDLRSALDAPHIIIDGIELQRDDLNTFYAARGYAPVWSFVGRENAASLNNFLESAEHVIDYHGLNSKHYPLDLMRQLARSDDDKDRPKLELLVTDTLLHLAHDLHGDDNAPNTLYTGWTFHRASIDIPAQLANAIGSQNLGDFINSLAPHHAAYQTLANALQTYRGIALRGGWHPISANPVPLRPHDTSPRTIQLRARLGAEGFASKPPDSDAAESQFFDDALAQEVATWQAQHGLLADGHVGANTLEALNEPVEQRIGQIRANMERWRHMPDDFPPLRYATVNIADATVAIFEDGKTIYHGPVVVGRVDRKTPFIDSKIRSMIINPSWHVPAKIARKDILPKLRKDPHYLEKLGFVISHNEQDPYGENIDWESVSARDFNFRLRQAPGDMNSLGRLKFDFNNDFAVYMHGTPHQELFEKPQRDFSSGCIRLRDPEQVAEILLAPNNNDWSIQKIEDEINAGTTRWVGLTNPMPLYVLYWTVFADENGTINFRKDAYGYDALLISQ